MILFSFIFFFFQAEDGIRDIGVTGVQTCALPISGCTLFTKFDIRWGYNNVRIKEGDEWKAAFLTPEGLFEPTVMFFGLTNSPATFQMMMNMIFRREIAQGWLSVYMDDLAIHTK